MRAAGLILNVRLGLGVWDYSDLRGNLWGQIRLQFAAIWWGLCLVFIPVFDWMRYAVAGGERPRPAGEERQSGWSSFRTTFRSKKSETASLKLQTAVI